MTLGGERQNSNKLLVCRVGEYSRETKKKRKKNYYFNIGFCNAHKIILKEKVKQKKRVRSFLGHFAGGGLVGQEEEETRNSSHVIAESKNLNARQIIIIE